MKLIQRLGITYIQTKFKLLSVVSKKHTAKKAFKVFGTPIFKSVQKCPLKNADKVELILNNKKIIGYRWNHPQPKKALILHGFGSAAYKFEEYANIVAEKGYEILAFDAPAHGNSEGNSTNAIEYCAMIEKVIKKFGPVNSFIAHSFGGISLSLALEKLPHDADTKVVFIAPATETTSAVNGAFNMLKIKNEQVRAEFEKIVVEISGKNTAWFSMRRAMNNISASVLWIHDKNDDITPWADAEKVQSDNHSNIRFIITTGLGHSKIYHDKMVKEQVKKFL